MTDFVAWLRAIGLDKHHAVLVANDIDLDVLGELTEGDLKELGLSLGDRKRLMRAVGRRTDAPADTDPPPVSATPPAEKTIPTGDRRQVTIMFADISGFTRMTDTMDAEEVHHVLATYFGVVDAAVRAYGGTIDKHIGDAAMALFGAPVAHTDDPERAVRAALDIHRALADLDPPLTAHIGIASGSVLADRTGSAHLEEYTVTGAAVNLAARLQDRAGAGETLISGAVHAVVGELVRCEALGEIGFKGIDAPVAVWSVLALTAGSVTDPDRPFVGRSRERRQLAAVLSECLEGRAGQAVLIRGEPGIGKTSLVDWFQAEAEQAGAVCHTGLVLDFGVGKGRDAMPALVRSLLDIRLGSGKQARRAAAEGSQADGRLPADAMVHLNALLDLPQPETLRAIHGAMDNRARIAGRAQAIATLVAETGRRAPLVLRVEDIHWADGELLGQLAAIARVIATVPVILVMTTRIDGDPIDSAWRTLVRDCPMTTIDLGPLPEDEAMTLAERYLDMNDRRVRACVDRAAGNPFFLDQLLRDAEANTQDGEAAGVPGSIQSIVQARLDALSTSDRSALQAAAVLGQRFAPDAVSFVIESAAYDCSMLVGHQLARPEGDGYLFAHALVRDGIYASMRRDRRRALHARAAAWYRDRDTSLYARHLDEAGDPMAAPAYLAAADEQRAAYRYDRALPLVERGRALATDRTERFTLACANAEILGLLGDNAESIIVYTQALDLAGNPEEEARARLGRAGGMRILDDYDGAFTELERVEAITAETDHAQRARVYHLRGNLNFPLGRHEACRHAHEQALEHARRSGELALETQALGGLADAAYAQGRIRSAQDYFTRCVAGARAHGLAGVEVANFPMVAWTNVLMGEYDTGLRLAEEAIALAERVGSDRAAAIAYNATSCVFVDRGQVKEAIEASEAIVRLSDRLGAGRLKSYGLNMCALAALLAGDHDAGRRYVDEALVVAEQSALTFAGGWIFGVQARIATTVEAMRGHLERGEALLSAGALAHNHYFFRREAIDACLAWKLWDEAERHAAAFESYVGGEGGIWVELVVMRARALAAWACGEREEAVVASLRRAQALARSMGWCGALSDIDRALAGIPE
ncbi:MAG: AAA family ATPase [Alphaproteobacteria bacterium]|nr:AAA family ATPase [Alphaproteobacteria bacterium]